MVLNQGDFAPWGTLTIIRDILVVTTGVELWVEVWGRGGVELTSSGYRLEILLHILQCSGQSPIQPQNPNSAETKPSLGLLYKMKCDKFLYNLVSVSLLKYFPLSNAKNFITHSISPSFFTSSNYINPCACPFLGLFLFLF